jgi:hypothetical protein
LNSNELHRFADERFQPLIRLRGAQTMTSNEIIELASTEQDRVERFLHRSFTRDEQYRFVRHLLQSYLTHADMLDELESIVQRRLTERELRTLADKQYEHIERRLGQTLTEQQLRHLLHGDDDLLLNDMNDDLKRVRTQYDDNRQRTHRIVHRLLADLDRNYSNVDQRSRSASLLSMPSPILVNHKYTDERQTTTTDDHHLSEHSSTSTVSNTNIEHRARLVQHITTRESIEDLATINEIVQQLRQESTRCLY